MAEIRWFGHNCIRVRSKDVTVLIDPVGKQTGYTLSKQTADIVLLTHQHPGHMNTAAVKPDYTLIDGPGEYELNGIFVFGIRAYHDKEKGAQQGYNTLYTFHEDGLLFGHLGDLGHPLNDTQLEAFEGCDVLFAPIGGESYLPVAEMAQVVGTISPKLVVPMQFRTDRGDKDREELATFCKHLSLEVPAAVEKLILKPSDLSDQMALAVLTPES